MAKTKASLSVPPHLATARSFIGLKEIPGDASNPVILAWPAKIAAKFPLQTAYWSQYRNDDTAWCGVFVSVCLAINDIEPPYDPVDELKSGMWAQSFKGWGVPVSKPQLGDVLVFARHVTFYNGEDGAYYLCVGGNQGDSVRESRYLKSECQAIRRAPAANDNASPPPIVVSPAAADMRRRMAKVIVDFEARRDSQGRLAVYQLPAGDGGGTYEVAGINDRYHPTEAAYLASLIRQGKYDEAESFIADFLVKYTDAVLGWATDLGVEFFLRDCAFNRGPTGAARIFQRALGVEEDGEIGPITLAASALTVATAFLPVLREARESYERNPVGRDETSKFWAGLVNRWNDALTIAKRFSDETPEIDMPEPIDPNTPAKPPIVGDNFLLRIFAYLQQNPDAIPRVVAFATFLRTGKMPVDPNNPAPVESANPPSSTLGFGTGILGTILAALGIQTGFVPSPTTGSSTGLLSLLLPIALSVFGAGGGVASILSKFGIRSPFGK